MNNVRDVVDLYRSPRSPLRSSDRHKIADVHFPRPKSHSFTDPPLKLPPAVDGFEAGATVKTDEEAKLLSNLFKRCGKDRKFSVGDRRPSYPDYDSIKGPLEALDRDRGCSKMQFLDRRDRKWSVIYHVQNQRAALCNEEARLESRTPCSVPSSIHIHTLTSATHIRGHCRHDRHRREVSRAALNRRSVSFGPTTKLPARRYRQRTRS